MIFFVLMFSRSWLKPWQMTQGHPWEFHLLLLCLYNGFFSFTLEKPQVPPTHTLHFFLPSLFLFFFLLPPLADKCTYTHAKKTWVHAHIAETRAHARVFANHLWQICWWLCPQIKLMTSYVRSQRTKWCCYRCPSPQYPAPKPDERSMIYQSVSVVLAWGWFTNTKHTDQKKGTPPPSVEWWCSVDLITHMQPQLNTCSSSPRLYFLLWRKSLFSRILWVQGSATWCHVHAKCMWTPATLGLESSRDLS